MGSGVGCWALDGCVSMLTGVLPVGPERIDADMTRPIADPGPRSMFLWV